MKLSSLLFILILFMVNYNTSHASFYSVEDDLYDARPGLFYILEADIENIRNIQELDDLRHAYHEKLLNLNEELKKLNETSVSDRTGEEYRSKTSKLRIELSSTVRIIDWLLARREILETHQHMVSSQVIDKLNKKNN